jgi:hypothetical protein
MTCWTIWRENSMGVHDASMTTRQLQMDGIDPWKPMMGCVVKISECAILP